MTFMDQSHATQGRPATRRHTASLINWWRERQRLKRDYRKLPQMPDHLLRDVGLEHLIELKPDTPYRHRLL
ncbi:DUF1127 domain-containing protein [Sedimentitalea todarodis]|uniref:DUF1127 domain-containing protein n=1 Tax=Sedimentitalea todarodis TaxID=1631240 RepID=A0ABU3VLQ3_9RHOB|nr:DUF1127 domain-containing protein [Sedimentitalea todarodis]MDU9007106.1 DUF1127 domain-containing protein [Sedimentitalea todarodis]